MVMDWTVLLGLHVHAWGRFLSLCLKTRRLDLLRRYTCYSQRLISVSLQLLWKMTKALLEGGKISAPVLIRIQDVSEIQIWDKPSHINDVGMLKSFWMKGSFPDNAWLARGKPTITASG